MRRARRARPLAAARENIVENLRPAGLTFAGAAVYTFVRTTGMERFDDSTQVAISEHAAEWFLRLHAHDLSVAERFAYLQWLKASPTHLGETLQICRLYCILYPLKQQLSGTNEDA